MPQSRDASRQLKDFITPALLELSLPLAPPQIDEICDLVARSMTGEGRYFHTPTHVVQVAQGGDAVLALAAFFHDLVYFQVDQGISPEVASRIAPFVRQKKGKFFLASRNAFEKHPTAEVVRGVFGFATDELLAVRGVNEFLSALTAAVVLAPFVSSQLILEIAACIELTIPFRPLSDSQENAALQLRHRLEQVNHSQGLKLDSGVLDRTVARAVRMANQDVADFSTSDTAQLLKNTWELVPETNALLRTPSGRSLTGFRNAIQKTERFFSQLDPQTVFQQFQGEPTPEALVALHQNAHKQVEQGSTYFRLKLVSLAFFEALCEREHKVFEFSTLESLEKKLSKVPRSKAAGGEEQFLPLLEKSLGDTLGLADIASVLTAFLVREEGVHGLLKVWPSTRGQTFLDVFSPSTLKLVRSAL